MKKLFSVLFSILLLTSAITVNADEIQEYSPCFYNMNGSYTIKGEDFFLDSDETLIMVDGDMQPFSGVIKNGTTFVPVRAISELFGKQVLWYPETREIRIDEAILLQVGSNLAKNGDADIILTYPPFIEDGTTYVPLRFIAESFNKEVGYLSEDRWIFDNSLVWIDDKNVIDYSEQTINEITADLENYIYENYDNLIGYRGETLFNLRRTENIKYVGRIGRYLMFNSDVPILVDVNENKYYLLNSYESFQELDVLKLADNYETDEGGVITESSSQTLENNMGSVETLVYFDISDEIPVVREVDYTYFDSDGNEKFTAIATQWGNPYEETTLKVYDADENEVLLTNDLILTGKYDVVFEDMNFDGYVDIVTYNGGTMNVLNIIFLWNEETGVFEKALYEGFDMLSFYEIEDGYINNFIRGGTPEESYMEKLVWEGNKLIKVSEE